jgi:hypothetical protein
MKSSNLLKMIFDGGTGNLLVLSLDGDYEIDVENIPKDIIGDSSEIDMLLGDLCYGVRVSQPELATFSLTKGEKFVHVAVFEEPVPLGSLPADAKVDIPLISGRWKYQEGTKQLYMFDEVFGMSDDVTKTVMEIEDAEIVVDVEIPTREFGAEDGNGNSDEPSASEEYPCGVQDEQEEFPDPTPEPVSDARGMSSAGEEDHAVGEPSSTPAQGADNPEPAVEFNDAFLLGKATPAYEELLQKPVTLLLGEVWGLHDRRNTQDGAWAQVQMPWAHWIAGQGATNNTAAWGFSRHPVGKNKEGPCVVLGSSIGKARKAKAMEYMHAIGLDVDSGARLDDVIAKIESLGLFCIVYTSYNHFKRGIQPKRDDILRKLGMDSDPTILDIKRYLSQHDKHRYEADFIDRITIKEAKKQVKEGVVVDLNTPPLEKFRLIFPLSAPVKIIDLAATHEGALSVWEDKITGLARETLGVNFDTSCTDPSRLFYTARHPKDAEDWYCAIIQGDPLKFEDVPVFRKAKYTAMRGVLNPYLEAGLDTDSDMPPQAYSPKGVDLNKWHTTHKERFLLVDLLEQMCPERIRPTGGEAQGMMTTECPFEHEHSSDGGSACMAGNAIDTSTGYWTWFCHHDACQGRHKLQFLEEALRTNWFDEALLSDKDAGFILPPSDQDMEDEEITEEAEVVSSEDPATPLTWEDRASQFSKKSTQEDIEKFIKRLIREGVDVTVRANVIAVLTTNTNLAKRELLKLWDALEKAKKERDAKRASGDTPVEAGVIVSEMGFLDMCNYGQRRIHDRNAVNPTVFHYMEGLCLIRENSEGHARIKTIDRDGFAHHLNTTAKFLKKQGEDDALIDISAPDDVVKHLFSSDFSTYPELRGVVTTPIFTKAGALLDTPGYDRNSKLFYCPDQNLVVRAVADKPTMEDVAEAKRLLISEVLADFPLGGFVRSQIEEQCLSPEGEGVPAVANVMAMILLPFLREMVEGPTPGHLIRKSTPGTGASLLTDVFSIIATGRPTPALALPTSKEEMSKTLTSVLANGQNIVFFDNVNHSMDSGELASAMTAPTYQARVLGKTQTVEVDVRCVWTFSGNNISASKELLRRMVSCELDANMANPELRTSFRHNDIRGWATENRGALVWACLTLIRNFVAKGMPKQNDAVLASYENWSRVVGGVLKEAGIKGFLQNRDELMSSADDDNDDELMVLLECWWQAFRTKEIHLKGKDKVAGLVEQMLMDDVELSVKKTKSNDGDDTYNLKALGQYLSKFKDRVFKLEDGTEVSPKKLAKRTKDGHMWRLVSSKQAPKSNVGAE